MVVITQKARIPTHCEITSCWRQKLETTNAISAGCCHDESPKLYRKEARGAEKGTREEDEERGEGIRDARERDSGQPFAVCPSVRLYITCKRLGY